jgi:hypothetical protein
MHAHNCCCCNEELWLKLTDCSLWGLGDQCIQLLHAGQHGPDQHSLPAAWTPDYPCTCGACISTALKHLQMD